MMLDADVVAVSPSSVYRVLRDAGLMKAHNSKPSLKGQGLRAAAASPRALARRRLVHQHRRHVLLPLQPARRLQPVHRPLGDPREHDRGRRRDDHPAGPRAFPDARPRIISDNGPQFIAKDFKEFIRICGMTHVRTSPYYPQSNGKIERWHKTLKGECIRVKTPLSLEDARRIVAEFVAHYNEVRLHSAIGYVTPADKLAGRDRAIFAERDRKLDAARERRKSGPRGESAAALISATGHCPSRSAALR